MKFDDISLDYFIYPLIKSDSKNLTSTNKLINLLLKKGIYLNEKIKERFYTSKEKKLNKILFIMFNNFVKNKTEKEKILDELKKRKIDSSILVCNPLSNFFNSKIKKNGNLFYSYCDKKIKMQSKYFAKKISKKYNKTKKNDKMDFFLSSEILYILFRNYLTFKKIIQKNNTQIVFLNSLFGFYETPLLLSFNKLNRKIFFYPHGYGWRNFKIIDKSLTKNTFFLVSGREEKNILLESGIKRKNIRVTGSPLFDKIPNYKKIKPDDNIITFLTQPLVEDGYVDKNTYFNYFKRFLLQINKANINNLKIIIKLHPRERYKKKYRKIMKSLKINGKIIQTSDKDSLYSVIARSSLLISFGSTADIEGLMLNKNIIDIDRFKGNLMKKDKSREAVVVINKNGDLTKAINEVLYNKNLQKRLEQKRTKYLNENFYKVDGKASERIADLICKLITKS